MEAIPILAFICVLQNEKTPQVVSKLKQVINSDADEAIRAVAIYNLGRLYEAMKDLLYGVKGENKKKRS